MQYFGSFCREEVATLSSRQSSPQVSFDSKLAKFFQQYYKFFPTNTNVSKFLQRIEDQVKVDPSILSSKIHDQMRNKLLNKLLQEANKSSRLITEFADQRGPDIQRQPFLSITMKRDLESQDALTANPIRVQRESLIQAPQSRSESKQPDKSDSDSKPSK